MFSILKFWKKKSNKLVLIDAGHGGMIDGVYQTKGKRSPVWEDGRQYFEGVGNRILRAKVAAGLEKLGIEYKYVTYTEKDISLRNRVAAINKICNLRGFKNVLLLSIHSDAFSKESAHGWSVYTSVGDTGTSDIFATNLYLEMIKQFPNMKSRIDMSDGDVDKEAQFYILRKSYCPAALVENFFMTNRKECQEILMTEDGQDKIAQGLINGIVKTLKI
jgi:N-acetylmuramoyl-L-alanine amidase|tara:strand:- start:683 stop:1336 length:654 start_codon:yes stop_codon:yes gene_type:complete